MVILFFPGQDIAFFVVLIAKQSKKYFFENPIPDILISIRIQS